MGDIRNRRERDCLELMPTVVSFLVGVNDAIHAAQGAVRPLDAFRADYRAILETTRKALPKCRIVLCEPFLVRAGEVTDRWVADLQPRQKVVCELADEFADHWVSLQIPFDDAVGRDESAYWAFDGIHPTCAGFELIAREWERRAGNLLQK